jgi:hypothetical protein
LYLNRTSVLQRNCRAFWHICKKRITYALFIHNFILEIYTKLIYTFHTCKLFSAQWDIIWYTYIYVIIIRDTYCMNWYFFQFIIFCRIMTEGSIYCLGLEGATKKYFFASQNDQFSAIYFLNLLMKCVCQFQHFSKEPKWCQRLKLATNILFRAFLESPVELFLKMWVCFETGKYFPCLKLKLLYFFAMPILFEVHTIVSLEKSIALVM